MNEESLKQSQNSHNKKSTNNSTIQLFIFNTKCLNYHSKTKKTVVLQQQQQQQQQQLATAGRGGD